MFRAAIFFFGGGGCQMAPPIAVCPVSNAEELWKTIHDHERIRIATKI